MYLIKINNVTIYKVQILKNNSPVYILYIVFKQECSSNLVIKYSVNGQRDTNINTLVFIQKYNTTEHICMNNEHCFYIYFKSQRSFP